MLLKRIDDLGNKTYINALTGTIIPLKYVGHRKKIKQTTSAKDAKRIDKMKWEVGHYRNLYLNRLLDYSLKNNTNR